MEITRKWLTVPEVAALLGFGLSKTRFLVLAGDIRSVKHGHHRRILPEWVDEYVRTYVEEHAG